MPSKLYQCQGARTADHVVWYAAAAATACDPVVVCLHMTLPVCVPALQDIEAPVTILPLPQQLC